LVTLVGLISKKWHPDRTIRQRTAAQGAGKLEAIAQAARIRLRAPHDDERRNRCRPFSVDSRQRCRRSRANSIGLVLVGGMTVGTIFTLFIVPSLYMLIAKEHHEKSLESRKTRHPPKMSILHRNMRWRGMETATVGSKADERRKCR